MVAFQVGICLYWKKENWYILFLENSEISIAAILLVTTEIAVSGSWDFVQYNLVVDDSRIVVDNFHDLSKNVFMAIYLTSATIWESGKEGHRVRSELEIFVFRILLMCPAVLWNPTSLWRVKLRKQNEWYALCDWGWILISGLKVELRRPNSW